VNNIGFRVGHLGSAQIGSGVHILHGLMRLGQNSSAWLRRTPTRRSFARPKISSRCIGKLDGERKSGRAPHPILRGDLLKLSSLFVYYLLARDLLG